MPPFPRDSKTNISSLLNDPDPGPSRALTAFHPELITDHIYTSDMLENIVSQTSGCSVEQLEQIYSALMSEIWRMRDVWDRARVARNVFSVFADVMEDIRMCQGVGQGSMEIEE